MTKKYGRIRFSTEQGYSCCGQLVVYGMEEGGTEKPPWSHYECVVFNTRKEQHDDFISRLQTQLEEEVSCWNNEQYDEDEELDSLYGFLSMTLVSHPTPQIEGLVEYLIDNGWQMDQEVVNPKTKNTIVHLSKAL